MADRKVLRGRVLNFISEPQSPDDEKSYQFFTDGCLILADGKIEHMGDYTELVSEMKPDDQVIDHQPHLILAGFIDTHVHFPQLQVIASWGAQLLDWLNTYTFPEEMKFHDPEHAGRIAKLFLDELFRNGTTTAVAYCSVHKASAEAFFEESLKRNASMVAGKVMMDRNAPEKLCDTPQSGYDDSKALIEKYHGQGRLLYAITPRFAITSTPEQLEMSGTLCREHPDCYMQTHLSENHDEIEFTASLYPKARDYLDIYEHYGLLGEKSLFGHCIHLVDREVSALADSKSVAVFCPTSNLFLGSGLYDEARLRRENVRTAIATDVGGGSSFSMFRTLDEGYKILQLLGQKLNPLKAFYWSTLGNALALGLDKSIGTLKKGTDADIVVLDSQATPVMATRMETVESLFEELFVLQTLGDDRAVIETYVAGEAVNLK